MDEGSDASELDNVDFEDTDIPTSRSRRSFVEATRRRSATGCGAVNGPAGGQALPTRTCGKCNGQTYVAGLTCCRCKARASVCRERVPGANRAASVAEGRARTRGDWKVDSEFGTVRGREGAQPSTELLFCTSER